MKCAAIVVSVALGHLIGFISFALFLPRILLKKEKQGSVNYFNVVC